LLGDVNQHEFLVQKLGVIFEYLLKTMLQNPKEMQVHARLEAFSNEDNNILGKAIKIVLYCRSPKQLTSAILAKQEPNYNEISIIAQTLNIALTQINLDEEDRITESYINKRGKYSIGLGYDS
jgi:hypothetical protein